MPDLLWPEGPQRLVPLLRVKGLGRSDLMAHLNVKRSRVVSWLVGARRPVTKIAIRLAAFLDVPLDYLFNGPSCAHLAKLQPAEVAARASLDIVLHRGGDQFPTDLRLLLESFVKSLAAPRSVKEWDALIADILEPSFAFAERRQKALQRMLPKVRKGRRTHPGS